VNCPSCGKELEGEIVFCPYCGTRLVEAPARAGREERKVVTVLFADLVGFTARSEELDPEDVRALLAPFRRDQLRDLRGRRATSASLEKVVDVLTGHLEPRGTDPSPDRDAAG
jgi:uncharacterized Zn finger protein (UPF0148 family)